MRFDTLRIVVLVLLNFSLAACITLPGHRQIIDEGDFYLRIETPNKAAKNLIRFNAEKTGIAYLPARSEIELVVVDVQGKHEMKVKRSKDAIVYQYKLNGRRTPFGAEQQEWFASLVPEIISRTGLQAGPH